MVVAFNKYLLLHLNDFQLTKKIKIKILHFKLISYHYNDNLLNAMNSVNVTSNSASILII